MFISFRHAAALLVAARLLPGVAGDFLGPSFPAPSDLTSDTSLVKAAWQSVTAALAAAGLGDNAKSSRPANTSSVLGAAQNITFSIGLFSLHDPDTTSLQFHHTSPEIAASTVGTKKVDNNSIYRVASVTKVFTALAGLLSLTDADWERPLSDIFPILRSQPSSTDDVLSTRWDKITMRTLAAQLGGVPRDGFPGSPGEIALQLYQANVSTEALMAVSGLPAPNPEADPLAAPPCLVAFQQGRDCTAEAYLAGVANRAPTFSPWTGPAYSNNGFTLLGLALANVTGHSVADLFQQKIFTPLAMASSFSDPPPPSQFPRGVIIGPDATATGFAAPNGLFVSSGGVFSTTGDLARFGVGILNSSLLPAERTRRWLKPVSHTARLQYAVGAPWEILRFVGSGGKVTDLYTKSGDSGLYSSWLVLVPDYGFGFSILSAGSAGGRVGVVAALADLVTQAVLPALEGQAAVEAGEKLAGRYRAADEGLNSTLVLGVVKGTAGLVVEEWISNGTDVLPWLAKVVGPGPFRLLPSVEDDKGARVAFRLVGSTDSPALGDGAPGALFAAPGMVTADWISVDVNTYYGAGLSLFVFDVGKDGKATAVTIPAWRVTLTKSAGK
ncbi:beta-lactamase/transpeptidase-like protein [Echria macrotheca]|uniref:Beta-lactamase/transpeptidase-like protein n=1 Tax=Echria macrotheca TaxID=438768 RepID=A0AAJ0FGB1_9PEZI|nr:beta-lactamase/transpeptidase-like protein [Echria macrotheca]